MFLYRYELVNKDLAIQLLHSKNFECIFRKTYCTLFYKNYEHKCPPDFKYCRRFRC